MGRIGLARPSKHPHKFPPYFRPTLQKMTSQPEPEREPLEVTHPHLKRFLRFLPELNKESDRGGVLISCSYVDELLRQTLLAFFIENDNSNRLVEGFNAPLGTFSTRISAAFALGLISEREFRECNTLRRVRNRFAHHLEASFDMQDIRDLCENLTYAVPGTVDARERYTSAVVPLILNLVNRPHYVSKKRREFNDWPY
jgi:mannitol operon repressor